MEIKENDWILYQKNSDILEGQVVQILKTEKNVIYIKIMSKACILTWYKLDNIVVIAVLSQ